MQKNKSSITKYSIKQTTQHFKISKDTLLRYEKENLITPLRANKRGDRIYTPEHFDLIAKIRLQKQQQYKLNALHMVEARKKLFQKHLSTVNAQNRLAV